MHQPYCLDRLVFVFVRIHSALRLCEFPTASQLQVNLPWPMMDQADTSSSTIFGRRRWTLPSIHLRTSTAPKTQLDRSSKNGMTESKIEYGLVWSGAIGLIPSLFKVCNRCVVAGRLVVNSSVANIETITLTRSLAQWPWRRRRRWLHGSLCHHNCTTSSL